MFSGDFRSKPSSSNYNFDFEIVTILIIILDLSSNWKKGMNLDIQGVFIILNLETNNNVNSGFELKK